MKRTLTLILLLTLFLAGCAPAATPTAAPTQLPATVPTDTAVPPTAVAEPKTLNVFAAASLTGAFNEIGRNFEAANPGTTITFNFRGFTGFANTDRGRGTRQDVFASASKTNMDTLVTDNLVTQDAPQQFLNNKLVVILPKDNPAGLAALEDLAKPGIKLVLAADAVPVGKYALQALDLMDAKFGNGYKTRVLANVVSKREITSSRWFPKFSLAKQMQASCILQMVLQHQN